MFSPPQYPSLYKVDLSQSIGSEYAPVIDDAVRALCIQIAIQFMLYLNGIVPTFVSVELFASSTFTVLGVVVYWLLYKNILGFR